MKTFDQTIEKIIKYFSNEKTYKMGLKNLNSFVRATNFETLKPEYIQKVIKLVLTCFCRSYLRADLRKKSYVKDQKLVTKVLNVYKFLINAVYKDNPDLLLSTVQEILERHMEWKPVSLCRQILLQLFIDDDFGQKIFYLLLRKVHYYAICCRASKYQSQDVLRVIYELLIDCKWSSKYPEMSMRLINKYVHGIKYKKISPIRHDFIICIVKILERSTEEPVVLLQVMGFILNTFTNEQPDDLVSIKFCNLLKDAAILHRKLYSSETFQHSTYRNLLLLIGSKSTRFTLCGNKTLQLLIDRQGNAKELQTPRIFFRGTNYNLKFSECDSQERTILQQSRKELHVTFLFAFKTHYNNIHVLKVLFTSLALLLMEMPCDFCAAFLVCLLMNIQDMILTEDNFPLECCHRIHAIIISLMSLVCWVLDLKVLYEYLNKVLMLRSLYAPFLNPPLKETYKYCKHHVLWKHPDLFFENREVRYGLWKRFRIHVVTEELSRHYGMNLLEL